MIDEGSRSGPALRLPTLQPTESRGRTCRCDELACVIYRPSAVQLSANTSRSSGNVLKSLLLTLRDILLDNRVVIL